MSTPPRAPVEPPQVLEKLEAVLQVAIGHGFFGYLEVSRLACTCNALAENWSLGSSLRASCWQTTGVAVSFDCLLQAAQAHRYNEEALVALAAAAEAHLSNDGSNPQLAEILRDVGRTFPGHPLFAVPRNTSRADHHDSAEDNDSTYVQVDPWATPGLYGLLRVLTGFTLARPGIGYAQGMNYVAAVALMLASEPMRAQQGATAAMGSTLSSAGKPQAVHAPAHRRQIRHRSPEQTLAEVLSLLLALSDGYGCADLWRSQLPRLPLQGYILGECARKHTPLLHEHFTRVGFSFDIFAAQWLLPLCTTMLPVSTLRHVWRAYLAVGWKALIRVCVAILQRLEPLIVEADMDTAQISQILRDWKDCIGQAGKKASVLPRTASAGSSASMQSPSVSSASAHNAHSSHISMNSLGQAGAQALLLARYPPLAVLFDAHSLLAEAQEVKITLSQVRTLEQRFYAKVLESKVDALLQAQQQEAQGGVVSSAVGSAAARQSNELYRHVPLLADSAHTQITPAVKRMRIIKAGGSHLPSAGQLRGDRLTTSAVSPVRSVNAPSTGAMWGRSRVGSAMSTATATEPTVVPAHALLPSGPPTPSESRSVSHALSRADSLGSTHVSRVSHGSHTNLLLLPGSTPAKKAPLSVVLSGLPTAAWLIGLEARLQAELCPPEPSPKPTGPAFVPFGTPIKGVSSGGSFPAGSPPSATRRAVTAMLAGKRIGHASPGSRPDTVAEEEDASAASGESEAGPGPTVVLSRATPGGIVRRAVASPPASVAGSLPSAQTTSPIRSQASAAGGPSAPPVLLLPDLRFVDTKVLISGPADRSQVPKASICPSRLDCTPLYDLVVKALVVDVALIDKEANQDAALLTTKANLARESAGKASKAAKAAHDAQEEAQQKLQGLLAKKKELSTQLHDGMMARGIPASRGRSASVASSSPFAALLPSTSPRDAAPASPAQPPLKPVDLASFSAAVSALDDAVREAGQAWKTACWQSTLATTRSEELSGAADALMRTLVEAAEAGQGRRSALMQQAWRTMDLAWRVYCAHGAQEQDSWDERWQ